MNDMFISYDDECSEWVLYNWRDVDTDKLKKWLKEACFRCMACVVISDDMQWIWRNGERSKDK